MYVLLVEDPMLINPGTIVTGGERECNEKLELTSGETLGELLHFTSMQCYGFSGGTMEMARFVLPALVLGLFVMDSSAKEPSAKMRILKMFVNELVAIEPGKGKFPASFQMGSAKGEENELPQHKVSLKGPFAIAKYEVTQELYELVMGKNPSKWKGPRNSVEMVSWTEATQFCEKLTQMLLEAGLIQKGEAIRLPSEAEWEYCCRAGTTTPFSFPEAKDIDDYGWHRGNSKGEDPPVGVKKPNPWGLYDMHGYLHEWCLDHYHSSYKGAPTDGSAWMTKGSKEHVLRGGAWNVPASHCRSAFRAHQPTGARSDAIGFRCVKAKAKR